MPGVSASSRLRYIYELLFVLSELNTDQTTTFNYNYYRVTTIQVDVKKQGLRCPAVEVYFQTFFLANILYKDFTEIDIGRFILHF